MLRDTFDDSAHVGNRIGARGARRRPMPNVTSSESSPQKPSTPTKSPNRVDGDGGGMSPSPQRIGSRHQITETMRVRAPWLRLADALKVETLRSPTPAAMGWSAAGAEWRRVASTGKVEEVQLWEARVQKLGFGVVAVCCDDEKPFSDSLRGTGGEVWDAHAIRNAAEVALSKESPVLAVLGHSLVRLKTETEVKAAAYESEEVAAAPLPDGWGELMGRIMGASEEWDDEEAEALEEEARKTGSMTRTRSISARAASFMRGGGSPRRMNAAEIADYRQHALDAWIAELAEGVVDPPASLPCRQLIGAAGDVAVLIVAIPVATLEFTVTEKQMSPVPIGFLRKYYPDGEPDAQSKLEVTRGELSIRPELQEDNEAAAVEVLKNKIESYAAALRQREELAAARRNAYRLKRNSLNNKDKTPEASVKPATFAGRFVDDDLSPASIPDPEVEVRVNSRPNSRPTSRRGSTATINSDDGVRQPVGVRHAPEHHETSRMTRVIPLAKKEEVAPARRKVVKKRQPSPKVSPPRTRSVTPPPFKMPDEHNYRPVSPRILELATPRRTNTPTDSRTSTPTRERSRHPTKAQLQASKPPFRPSSPHGGLTPTEKLPPPQRNAVIAPRRVKSTGYGHIPVSSYDRSATTSRGGSPCRSVEGYSRSVSGTSTVGSNVSFGGVKVVVGGTRVSGSSRSQSPSHTIKNSPPSALKVPSFANDTNTSVGSIDEDPQQTPQSARRPHFFNAGAQAVAAAVRRPTPKRTASAVGRSGSPQQASPAPRPAPRPAPVSRYGATGTPERATGHAAGAPTMVTPSQQRGLSRGLTSTPPSSASRPAPSVSLSPQSTPGGASSQRKRPQLDTSATGSPGGANRVHAGVRLFASTTASVPSASHRDVNSLRNFIDTMGRPGFGSPAASKARQAGPSRFLVQAEERLRQMHR